ncbi:unnamed protein product [Lactuca virosa]|uniref:Uncharacterized protein n=1 Tax=Lactuca virosa TaxID=75947 RepID=A0AAU9P253_9ASTR|nr:unnamed protein product [Lactuca virosa]
MLHGLEGVPESSSILKQEGEGVNQSKKENPKPSVMPTIKPKSKNEPKGKVKLFNEEPIVDNSEDEEPDEHELKIIIDREAQMDEHQRIFCGAEVKENVKREAQATLESRKHLFLVWTLKQILSEVVDMPSQYWLEPVVSFDLQNTQDSQLDLPMTSKAFRFRSFVKVANVPATDSGAEHLLFSFYLKHMKS